MLRKKAECNRKVADYAFENDHYDAAVSRYYYYILQNILCYFSNNGIVIDLDFYTRRNTNSFLIQVIDTLIRYVKKNHSYEDFSEIGRLFDLRDQRAKSDYKEKILTKETFERNFNRKYKLVLDALMRLEVVR